MTDAPYEHDPSGSMTTSTVDAPSGYGSTRQPGGAMGTGDEGGSAVATLADEAKNQGGALAHDAASEARSVAGTASEQVRSLAGTARHHVAREADDATNRAAEALAGTAQDLTALARGEGDADSPAADVVRQIGERVEQVADRLRDGGYQGVVDDVSRWARSHPGTFLLAAAGTGFALGRLFRSVDTGAVLDATKQGAQPDGDGRGGRELDDGGPIDLRGEVPMMEPAGAMPSTPDVSVDPQMLASTMPAGAASEPTGAVTPPGTMTTAGGAMPSTTPIPDAVIDRGDDPAWQATSASVADPASEDRS